MNEMAFEFDDSFHCHSYCMNDTRISTELETNDSCIDWMWYYKQDMEEFLTHKLFF